MSPRPPVAQRAGGIHICNFPYIYIYTYIYIYMSLTLCYFGSNPNKRERPWAQEHWASPRSASSSEYRFSYGLGVLGGSSPGCVWVARLPGRVWVLPDCVWVIRFLIFSCVIRLIVFGCLPDCVWVLAQPRSPKQLKVVGERVCHIAFPKTTSQNPPPRPALPPRPPRPRSPPLAKTSSTYNEQAKRTLD
jgi:hypothetical protein